MKRLGSRYFSKILKTTRGLNTEDYGSQPESHEEVTDLTLTGEENPSLTSTNFTCVSSPSRTPLGDEAFHPSQQNVSLLGTQKPLFPWSSKRRRMEEHPGGLNTEEDGSQPESHEEGTQLTLTPEEKPSSSTNFTCVFSTSRTPLGDEAFHPFQQNVSPLGTQKPVSLFGSKWKRMEGHPGGLYCNAWKSHMSFPM
uniref:Uncharacterized protein n=1 Tax=Molossus molossus TaxID=27622 RepID=A0A7J8BLL2_MOLMO|nr:hypothetical protein HJG59_010187 [Molossus molossus]